MTTRPPERLQKIRQADNLHVAPFLKDETTYVTPIWDWSVAVDGDLYVLPCHGRCSRGYQVTLRQKAGHVVAAASTNEVTLEPIEQATNHRIDAAYRVKYCGSSSLNPKLRAHSATVMITSRASQ